MTGEQDSICPRSADVTSRRQRQWPAFMRVAIPCSTASRSSSPWLATTVWPLFAALLSNQISDIEIGGLKTAAPKITATCEAFPGRKKTHRIAVVRVAEDIPGMRSAGLQFWAGVLDTHFWFDPKKNVAAVLLTQSLSPSWKHASWMLRKNS